MIGTTSKPTEEACLIFGGQDPLRSAEKELRGVNPTWDQPDRRGTGGPMCAPGSPVTTNPPPASGPDALDRIAPNVLKSVRQKLIEQETVYQQQQSTQETFSSLWSHSTRVARIAHRIAELEGCETEPALLAGLLHDLGKFAHGCYHQGETPEETHAARLAQRILSGTIYERWIPTIGDAILSTYLDGEATGDIGRVVYDADCLDKLGNIGVAQFFAKKAMRRQFLDEDLMIRMSVELTYAHHAPETLKTATGRSMARERSVRTRRFYKELLEEWKELGLGTFSILEEEIAGIDCVLVAPFRCSCGGPLQIDSDIQDSVKCRAVVVKYRCSACCVESDFSFCLPNVRDLPKKDSPMPRTSA